MNGDVHQRSTSRVFPTKLAISQVLEVVLLILAGVLAIVLHARLRSPINIPGHHGMEFMAIILATRLASKLKWASSLSAFGIGIFILFPVLGFKDPMMGFNYMLPCIIMDLAYHLFQDSKHNKIFLSVAAGVAYMMIPISRIITTSITGFPYSSFLKHGFVTPVLTFMLFGLMGGILGTGLYAIAKRIKQKI